MDSSPLKIDFNLKKCTIKPTFSKLKKNISKKQNYFAKKKILIINNKAHFLKTFYIIY